MSLLLDALKKAADEKKKKQDLVDSAAIENQATDELDLDLEIDEFEYPQVDDGLLKFSKDVAKDGESINDRLGAQDEIAQDRVDVNLIISNERLPEAEELEVSLSEQEQPVHIDIEAVEEAREEVREEVREEFHVPTRKVKDAYFSEEKKDALNLLIADANRATRHTGRKYYFVVAGLVALIFLSMLSYIFLLKDDYKEPLDGRIIAQTENNEKLLDKGVEQEPVKALEQPVEEKRTVELVKPEVKKVQPVKKKVANKINVVRQSKIDPIDALLNKAYVEFNNGNYDEAKKLYAEVSQIESRNRDALLGLAAIAIKQNNYDYAAFRYAALLRLDPKDSYARAGLSSIESKLDPQKNESQLKMMIREQPDAAHLYFVLGSIYAGQKRWAEAQGEFFNAWSRESDNSDYAFNLAVSLDHLGKKQQALKFYQICLESGAGNFSNEQLKARIKTLKDNAHE